MIILTKIVWLLLVLLPGTMGRQLPMDGKHAKGIGGECLKSIERIISLLKYPFAQLELEGIVLNTGKQFNDLGYRKSCINDTNTTYYLITTVRTDLKNKFNYGLCLSSNCTLEDVDTHFAQDYINKDWLVHLANNTEYSPEDYLSHAVEIGNSPKLDTFGRLFVWGMCIYAAVFTLPLFWASIKKCKGKKEGPEQGGTGDGYREADDDSGSVEGLASILWSVKKRVAGSFNFFACLGRLSGSPPDRLYFSSLNTVRVLALLYTLAASEYDRRYFLGLNMTDKPGMVRDRTQLDHIIVSFYPFVLDVFVFISAAVNAAALATALQTALDRSSRKLSAFLLFYLSAVLRRILRLAPMYYLLLTFYYKVLPSMTSGPLQNIVYDYTSNCPDTFALSFSLLGNILKGVDTCMPWSWYIGLDLQLFLTAPLLVGLWLLSRATATLCLFFLCLSSCLYSLYLFISSSLTLPSPFSTSAQTQAFMSTYQTQPLPHVSLYALGLLFGLRLLAAAHRPAASQPSSLTTQGLLTFNLQPPEERQARGEELDLDPPPSQPSLLLLEDGLLRAELQVFLPTLLAALALLAVFGLYYAYVLSENAWGTVTQALFNTLSRLVIVMAVGLLCWPRETGKTKAQLMRRHSGALVLCGNNGLGFYLLQQMWVEMDILTVSYNQYYDGVLLRSLLVSDFFFIMFFASFPTLMLEIPFRHLITL
jgi:hypothetical protein